MRTHLTRLRTLCILAALLVAAVPVLSDDAEPPAKKPKMMVAGYDINEMPKEVYDAIMDKMWEEEHQEPPLVLQAYDIGTLLARAPAYRFALVEDPRENCDGYSDSSACGGGSCTIFEDSCCDDDTSAADRLRDLVVRFVRAEGRLDACWEEMGGRGSIDIIEERGLMLVLTTESMQKKVQALLETQLAPRPDTVAIQVVAVEFKDDFAKGLILGGAAAETGAKAILDAVAKVHGATTLSGKSGQRLSHNALEAVPVVADVEPVVAENCAGWDPTMSWFNSGLSVSAEATLQADGKSAVVDYRLRYGRTLDVSTVTLESVAAAQKGAAVVEKPRVVYDDRAGTVTVPLGEPVIVAGGMVPASLVAEDKDTPGKIPLYYLVTVRRLKGSGG